MNCLFLKHCCCYLRFPSPRAIPISLVALSTCILGHSLNSHLSKLVKTSQGSACGCLLFILLQLSLTVIWSIFIKQSFLYELLNQSLLETFLLLFKFSYFSCHFLSKFSYHFKFRPIHLPHFSVYKNCFYLSDPELTITFKMGFLQSRLSTELNIRF